MPTDVPPAVQETFERLKDAREEYIELKEIDGRYYVYAATSEWDSDANQPKKRTTYLGAISLEGEFTPKQVSESVDETEREIFEFGNGALAEHFLADLEATLDTYTQHAEELLAMAVIRAIDPQPLRLHQSRWGQLALSRDSDARLSPKYLSTVLKETGQSVGWWHEIFAELVDEDDLLLYDLTTIFSQSEQISLAEKGYNVGGEYRNQIGVVLAFSKATDLPAGVEVYWGSLKDISTIGDFLDRFQSRDLGFILDRGFWSEPLLEEFQEEGISYIAPLRKNSHLFDTRWVDWHGPFDYRGRAILWGRRQSEHGPIYFFQDPELEGEQKGALLRKVEQGRLDRETYEEKQERAGIVGLVSDLDRDGPEIFDLYKGRQDVEVAFDAMKNHLEADTTYLQDNDAVRGYYFVTFLALRVYFKILKRLRERDLTGKVSVNEVLYELSKVQLIVESEEDREYFAKIPKQARETAALFPEALPMG
jgi:transposase